MTDRADGPPNYTPGPPVRVTHTHTFAVLEVSPAVYAEVRRKLDEAGYQHAFLREGPGEVIDMHGIALGQEVVGTVRPLAPDHERGRCPTCGTAGKPAMVPQADGTQPYYCLGAGGISICSTWTEPPPVVIRSLEP